MLVIIKQMTSQSISNILVNASPNFGQPSPCWTCCYLFYCRKAVEEQQWHKDIPMANDTAPNLDLCAYNTLAWQGSFSCSAGELTVVYWLQHHFVSAKYLSELRAIACTSCLLKVYPIGEPTATIRDAAGKLQCLLRL